MSATGLFEETEIRLRRRHVVICVDDEPEVLAALRRLLENEPYELITTSDPDEVLMVVARRPVSLVLADQRMPAMPGTSLLEIIRKRSPSTSRAVITGCADISWISKAINESQILYLILKPWDDGNVKSTIRRLLQQRELEIDEAKRREWMDSPDETQLVHEEFVVRMDCRGQPAAQVLKRVLHSLKEGTQACDHFMLVLNHLPQMIGPVMPFLTTLFGQLLGAGVRSCVIDRSGYAAALVYIAGGDVATGSARIEAPTVERPKRVLIVESFEDSLGFVRSLLNEAGHACENAGSATEARQKWESKPFDLVLHDLHEDKTMTGIPDATSPGGRAPVMSVRVSLVGKPEDGCARMTLRRRLSASYCLGQWVGANRRK